MSLGSKSEINNFILEGRTNILLTLEHEVLGIMMDTNLRFYSHLKQLCKKVAKNLMHWPELSPILIKTSYCPLIWTLRSRRSHNLINKLQEGSLRVVYNDYDSSFNELLEKANENAIQLKNIRILILMTEIYKFLNGLSLTIMSEIFRKKDRPNSLGNPGLLITNWKSTVKYGINSIVYKSSKICQTLPTDLRNSESLSIFKCNIKKLRDINCQRKICKTYIPNVDYVDWRQ